MLKVIEILSDIEYEIHNAEMRISSIDPTDVSDWEKFESAFNRTFGEFLRLENQVLKKYNKILILAQNNETPHPRPLRIEIASTTPGCA